MRLIRWIGATGMRLTLTIALVVAVFHLRFELRRLSGAPLNFLQRLELTALDVKQSLRPPDPPEHWQIGVAAIDEKALETYGPLPWPRALYAELVDRLSADGARAIVLDMTFEEAVYAQKRWDFEPLAAALHRAKLGQSLAAVKDGDPQTDELKAKLERLRTAINPQNRANWADARLAASMKHSGRVVLGVLALSSQESEAIQLGQAQLEEALKALDPALIHEYQSPDPSGLMRVQQGGKLFEEGFFQRYFGLKVPAAQLLSSARTFGAINASPDPDGVNRSMPLLLGFDGADRLLPSLPLQAVAVALDTPIEIIARQDALNPSAIRLGDREIPLELGASALIHWYGPFQGGGMPTLSAAEILSETHDAQWAKDRVVFIAATAIGTHDQRVTALERATPGVYIHASLAQNLLDGQHLHRPPYGAFLDLLIIFGIGLISGWLTRFRTLTALLASALLAVAWMLLDALLIFPSGIVVPVVLPVTQVFITLLAASMWSYLVEERERRQTRTAFSRYLSPGVLHQVLSDPEGYLRLGGRRYEATVLFSDIRGFTTISEQLSPERLGELINRYLTPMTAIVFRHNGTLDKYIGDAVMAFWGAPVVQHDHALLAARAALEMVKTLKTVNQSLEARGLPQLEIGIGLSSGEMTIGNLGSHDHFAYTALGDRVNLGARLEGQTKVYGVPILISEATYQAVARELLCREIVSVRVKGKHEPVRVYELIGEREEAKAEFPFVEAFEKALKAFRMRRFDEAAQLFRQAAALREGPVKSCALYLSWCEAYRITPPPDDWDGVIEATGK